MDAKSRRKRKMYLKAYWEVNKEEICKNRRLSYAKNHEKINKSRRENYSENREKINKARRKNYRRAQMVGTNMKKNTTMKWSQEMLQAVNSVVHENNGIQPSADLFKVPITTIQKVRLKQTLETEDENHDKVEPLPSSSRNQPRLPKLQPCPAGISEDQSPEQPSSHSNLPPQHSRLSSHYPSHPPALSGPFTLPNQSIFDGPQLSMFLSETRIQNAELRLAMRQLTDEVDSNLNKLDQFSQYQSRQQRQKLRDKDAEFEVEEDDWGRNDDKELTISKSELMARIFAMEEKFEIMEKENISLKKDLEDTISKIVSLKDNQPIEISNTVTSALDSVYSDLGPKFSNGVNYEGLTIRKTIAATVIAVTDQFLDSNIGEKTDSDSCRGRKMEEVPTVQIKTRSPGKD